MSLFTTVIMLLFCTNLVAYGQGSKLDPSFLVPSVSSESIQISTANEELRTMFDVIGWISQLFSRSTVIQTISTTFTSYMTCPPTIATTYITVTNTSRMNVFVTCTASTTACANPGRADDFFERDGFVNFNPSPVFLE